jgi:hypothetical protein
VEERDLKGFLELLDPLAEGGRSQADNP